MGTAKQYIREGFHNLTPYLQVRGGANLIEFYKTAFDAEEIFRFPCEDGSIGHCELRIGGSLVEMADGGDRYPPIPTAIHLYVKDADDVYRRAVAAGAESLQAPVDQAYGDREAAIKDAAGNHWYIATHKGASYIPEGLRAVTPYLHVAGAAKLIEFMKAAFGAEATHCMEGANGAVAHATVRLGDSQLEVSDAHGEWKPMPGALHLYVPDTDAAYRAALAAGAVTIDEPIDKPYGDRAAGVRDPAGNAWYLATWLGKSVSAIPEAYAHVAPYLCVKDAPAAIEFYKQAFGATEILRLAEPSGRIGHAELRIGPGVVMLSDEYPEMQALGPLSQGGQRPPVAMHIYVENVDDVCAKAVDLGATQIRPPKDEFYGDRSATLRDPFGHFWMVATHKEDVTPAEMTRRFANLLAG